MTAADADLMAEVDQLRARVAALDLAARERDEGLQREAARPWPPQCHLGQSMPSARNA